MCGALKDLEDGIKSVGRSIDDGIHSLGRGIDDAVNNVVPGGWGTLAAGAGLYLAGGIPGFGKFFGGTVPGEQFMGGMGGFGGMTGAGVPGAGAFASGTGGIGSMFGMSASQLGGAADLLRGGFGLYQSNQLKKAAQPSAINRQAEAELAALMADPNRITSMPGYEAGLEAVQRGMAAGGYLGSGNMATALQKYGGDFYNNALTQYGNLSQLGRGNEATYRMGGIELAGQALNSLGYGGLKLFGK
jgi:hypothetical protein